MKGLWNDTEVKDLFSRIEEHKNKNQPLKEAFSAHALKYGRKCNSVRNYYYHEIDNLENDSRRAKVLDIDVGKHKKSKIAYFSEEEEQALMQEVDKLVKQGMSVRKACLTLSKGDVGQMLRYQNKYRNFLSKERKDLSKEIPSNVITFKKAQKSLSDSEVQSLFMGLVRLVKKNALLEGEEKYKAQLEHANSLLRKTLTDLTSSQRELEKIKLEFGKIKTENAKLVSNMLRLKCEKASLLNKDMQSK